MICRVNFSNKVRPWGYLDGHSSEGMDILPWQFRVGLRAAPHSAHIYSHIRPFAT